MNYKSGPARGKVCKSPVIHSYATAFCELSIAIVVSLSSKSALYSVNLAVISACQYTIAGQWRSFQKLAHPPVSRHLNCRYSTCCRLVENGCILVISVSVFPFPPDSSLSYIRMVVVPIGRCCVFVVVLVSPIVLMRVGDIPVSQWSIHFVIFC